MSLARRWSERDERWTAEDVTWVVIASVVGVAVILTGLIEWGENDRFRSTVDPFLLGFPLLLICRWVRSLAASTATAPARSVLAPAPSTVDAEP